MATTRTVTLLTAEELARLPDDDRRRELVRGEVIEMAPVGRGHGAFVLLLGGRLFAWAKEGRHGEAETEVGFILSHNPDTVRAPDISFVQAERLAGAPASGYLPLAPDLAVEVVSPDDSHAAIHAKIGEYLSAGTRLKRVGIIRHAG